jgi:hypothetical protein
MGKPGGGSAPSSRSEYIGARKPTRRTETSKYPQEEKSNEIPQVAASERGRAQTGPWTGVVGPRRGLSRLRMGFSRSPLERGAVAGESPVGEKLLCVDGLGT